MRRTTRIRVVDFQTRLEPISALTWERPSASRIRRLVSRTQPLANRTQPSGNPIPQSASRIPRLANPIPPLVSPTPPLARLILPSLQQRPRLLLAARQP